MCKRVKNLAPNLGDTKWIKGWSCHAMSFISSTAFNMVTSATLYRSTRCQVMRIKLIARANARRMKKASMKSSLGGRVSTKTAKTIGRCLNLSYAEAVKEISLITQACLLPNEGVDF